MPAGASTCTVVPNSKHIEKKFLILEKEINNHCRRNEIEVCNQRKAVTELVSMEKQLTSENNSHWMFIHGLLEIVTTQEHSKYLGLDLEACRTDGQTLRL